MSSYGEEKRKIRELIWKRLEKEGVALFPNWGRIPNFRGVKKSVELLKTLPEWKRAKAIFVSPDTPQRLVRKEALQSGKKLIVATPKLREGFLLLFPEQIKDIDEAVRIRGMFKYGKKVYWDPPAPDLIVIGSVAVDLEGNRLGKGGGFGDREIKFFKERYGKIPVITNIHELQIVERVPTDPWDEKVDIIVTNKRVLRC